MKKKNNKILSRVLVGLLIAVGFSIVAVGSTYASLGSSTLSIKTKAALESAYQCQKAGAYASSFLASEYANNFVKQEYEGAEKVKLPYRLTSVEDNTTSCKKIMLGGADRGDSDDGYASDDLWRGLVPENLGINSNGTVRTKEVVKFFAGTDIKTGAGGIGYKAKADTTTAEEGQTFKLTVRDYYSEETNPCKGNSNPFLKRDDNGKQFKYIIFPAVAKSGNGVVVLDGQYDPDLVNDSKADKAPLDASGEDGTTYLSSCGTGAMTIFNGNNNEGAFYRVTVWNPSQGNPLTDYHGYVDIINRDGQWRMSDDGGNVSVVDGEFSLPAFESDGSITISGTAKKVKIQVGEEIDAGDYEIYWDNNTNVNNVNRMLNGLNTKNTIGYNIPSLGTGYQFLALSRQEVYDLYKYYIEDVVHLNILCEGDDGFEFVASNPKINWRGNNANCRIKDPGDIRIPSNLYGVLHDGPQKYHLLKKITSLDDITNVMDSLGNLCSPKLDGAEGCSGDPENPENNSEFDCDKIVEEKTEGKGIGAMQWVLCPNLNNTAYTADWLDELTKWMIEIDPAMYKDMGNTWGTFRNLANIVIAVFLLFVIFSQVTGYGIDNYGIKKMLPRIIMMAIIVNLSFYICELVVDLSNIAGVGLRNLFGGAAGAAGNDSSYVTGGLLGIFEAIGPALGPGMMVGGWAGVIVALVIMVIVIIVAVVTLVVMLGARDIIIVFCMLISPLALAAYILPNTQHLYKKWYDLFKTAVIIFPLCGAMSGISATLKRMQGNGEIELGVGGSIIMLILPFLIFFLLPMLLQQAINALGKLGGALSRMGSTVRGGAQSIGQAGMRGVQNSERFKDWNNYRQQQAMARRAQRVYNSLHGRANLSARDQDRLRKAQDVLAAQHLRETENRVQTQGDYLDAVRAKQEFTTGEAARDIELYNNEGYVHGKGVATQIGREKDLDSTLLYNDEHYAHGKREQQSFGIRQDQRSTNLYDDPRYVRMMDTHGEISVANEKEKMYSENFANQDKVANTRAFTNALTGTDAEEAAAAFTTLNSQGLSEAMDVVYNADWSTMDSSVRDKLLTRMSESNVDAFKSFAKYRQSGGVKSFKDWMNGVGPVEHGVKDATYASHLSDLKEHAMDAYSKDEVEFINKNVANSLRTQLGAKAFGSMLKSTAMSSKDPKAQTQAEDIIKSQIKSGNMTASDLGITAENIGSLRGDTAKAIRQGYFDYFRSQGHTPASAMRNADAQIQTELSAEIAQAKADQRINNRTNNDVKGIFGM